tara:strand:+ start:331 stop:468 length:138 start_codon:yes stop_codon:yes gene_type:complete
VRHLVFGRLPAWVNAYIPTFITGPAEEKAGKSYKADGTVFVPKDK